jgi:hypothetical protein
MLSACWNMLKSGADTSLHTHELPVGAGHYLRPLRAKPDQKIVGLQAAMPVRAMRPAILFKPSRLQTPLLIAILLGSRNTTP